MFQYHREMIQKGLCRNEHRILITCVLVSCVFAVKLAGALLTNSLALFSDSLHLLTDIASLLFSLWGLRQARKSATLQYTFGYYRHGVLTAFLNNLSLIGISVYIFYSAVQRFFHPSPIKPNGMILIAAFGFALNCVIAATLRSGTKNITVKSVFLHFLGDALSDLGVLLGGIIILMTGIGGIDTLLSALLACLILYNAVKMTLECIQIMLEGAPPGLSLVDLSTSIKNIDGVLSVTDLHVWSLSKENLAMTAHICFREQDVSECEIILHRIQHLLKEQYGIEHSTIQFEHCPCSSCYHSKPDHRRHCKMCISQCPKGLDCSLKHF